MKSIYVVVLFYFITSCCGTKKVIESAPKSIVKSETSTEKKVDTSIINTVKTTKAKEKTAEPPKIPLLKSFEKEEIVELEFEAYRHYAFDLLLQEYVTSEGKVNYEELKLDNKILGDYIFMVSNNLPNSSWSKQEKLAYWINTYNALTIDLVLRYYPIKSIKDIKDPWEQRLWKLGDKWYNLNEIEHQILRKMNEPRIHFAIVCASYSCPKLMNRAYSSINLEQQLTKATKSFLADSNRNSISENSIEISKIFQWFAKDFKQEGTLIDFLNKYSDIEISEKAKKRFKDYNWDLNE